MAEQDEGQDKTEAPTPRRIEKAREEGNVPLSKEAVGFAALLGATVAAAISLPANGRELLHAMRGLIERPHEYHWGSVFQEVLWVFFLSVVPIIGLAAIMAILATFLQTRMFMSAKEITPDLSRISPISGFKRIFGLDALIEFLKTLIKISVVAAALWYSIADVARLKSLLQVGQGAVLSEAGSAVLKLMLSALAAYAAIALLDILFVRFRFTQKLRMNRQDLKEEMKETEGDPLVKAQLKQIRMQRARRRIAQAVPKATVVVTNPTHYAVALDYDAEKGAAPKVLAKGVDLMAKRIREIAQENKIPIVENPPLARALYNVEEEAEIPPDLYQATAEVIAYVMKLRGQAPAGRRP